MSDTSPTRSPWLEQLRHDEPARPLDADVATDVAVVGAGIAGAATAFYLLRDTDQRVVLLERGGIGHGATGHNAGQLASYFERSLDDLAREYGVGMAIDAQRAIDGVWDLIAEIVRDTGSDQRLERFTGNMGMLNLDHVSVHLRNSVLRRDGGLHVPEMLVSTDAPFLASIPVEFDGLYEVVPDHRIREVLGPKAGHYWAVLRSPIGAANGALLVQQIIDHLLRTHSPRFTYADHTKVQRIVLHADDAELHTAAGHVVVARRVVMCTNGFLDHRIENTVGDSFDSTSHRTLIGTIGFMHGVVEPGRRAPNAYSFIRNEHIGDDEIPYVYVTRRTWTDEDMLVVMGGPEIELDDATTYDADAPFPDDLLDEFADEVLPLAYPSHEPGDEVQFRWHGLMGYTHNKLRIIGPEPLNPVLLYNLGCNGVGFMPSIHGGKKIADILRGVQQPPSIFDPPG